MKFTPDGEILAVGMTNGAVQFWNADDMSKLFAIRPAQEVNPYEYASMMATPYKQGFIAFSPDANKAAVIGPKNVVTIWDLAEPSIPATLSFPGMIYGAGTMTHSHDSATLASAHQDVQLWSVQ